MNTRSALRPRSLLALVLLAGLAACSGPDGTSADAANRPGAAGTSPADSPVLPGIDVLLTDSLHRVAGLRAGLITNHTGIDRDGTPSIDRLAEHPEVDLIALFSPEHGIRGTAAEGVLIDDETDARTGLPIHSLYGQTRTPTPEMLEGIEILLFDIQDIGARYYTYIYTMSLAMEASGEAGIPFVVLDRPNAIGGWATQGNVLDEAFSSFVGLHPLPIRHGLTPGELARVYRSAFGIEADLHVIPVSGLRRDMDFADTGLPWRPPSPNMPSLESAYHYPGTCLFEGTGLSVGRGTDRAFQQIGAPWLDAEAAVAELEGMELPGVRFEAVRFTPDEPTDGKFGGEELAGIRLHVTDRVRHDPTRVGVALLQVAREQARAMGEDPWEWRTDHFDRLAGTDRLRLGLEAGHPLAELVAGWDAEAAAFRDRVEPLRIYPPE